MLARRMRRPWLRQVRPLVVLRKEIRTCHLEMEQVLWDKVPGRDAALVFVRALPFPARRVGAAAFVDGAAAAAAAGETGRAHSAGRSARRAKMTNSVR